MNGTATSGLPHPAVTQLIKQAAPSVRLLLAPGAALEAAFPFFAGQPAAVVAPRYDDAVQPVRGYDDGPVDDDANYDGLDPWADGAAVGIDSGATDQGWRSQRRHSGSGSVGSAGPGWKNAMGARSRSSSFGSSVGEPVAAAAARSESPATLPAADPRAAWDRVGAWEAVPSSQTCAVPIQPSPQRLPPWQQPGRGGLDAGTPQFVEPAVAVSEVRDARHMQRNLARVAPQEDFKLMHRGGITPLAPLEHEPYRDRAELERLTSHHASLDAAAPRHKGGSRTSSPSPTRASPAPGRTAVRSPHPQHARGDKARRTRTPVSSPSGATSPLPPKGIAHIPPDLEEHYCSALSGQLEVSRSLCARLLIECSAYTREAEGLENLLRAGGNGGAGALPPAPLLAQPGAAECAPTRPRAGAGAAENAAYVEAMLFAVRQCDRDAEAATSAANAARSRRDRVLALLLGCAPRTVSVARGTAGFGLQVHTAVEEAPFTAHIESVAPESSAAGALQSGDLLLEVDGQSVLGLGKRRIAAIFEDCGAEAVLQVAHPPAGSARSSEVGVG